MMILDRQRFFSSSRLHVPTLHSLANLTFRHWQQQWLSQQFLLNNFTKSTIWIKNIYDDIGQTRLLLLLSPPRTNLHIPLPISAFGSDLKKITNYCCHWQQHWLSFTHNFTKSTILIKETIMIILYQMIQSLLYLFVFVIEM